MSAFPKADIQNMRIDIELMSAIGRKQTFGLCLNRSFLRPLSGKKADTQTFGTISLTQISPNFGPFTGLNWVESTLD